ncbi:II/X family phage/plasmid replication protein [Paraburkholderia sp. BL6665CI2N2]|uniref:phage/plasmid replication protein, II/X family n=1 Tax=Paraburkholderia sp. BL6665CI2N2 TaxID=1938806 RepID=UPI00106638F3|nr:phage/plasmid replication protein, II/X family [Paraburkholderia sp. BL6665CI2N2]TDY25995.1 II/X family phage/plasmid replication protein [Paraburkholderia sp. BL6665CI2N2]
MIDLIHIEFPFDHKPFGNERIKRIEGSGSESSMQFSKQIRLSDGGSLIDVMSLRKGTKIAIHCCPLKPLQGHNVFGSNSVRLLCFALICGVLRKMKLPYDPEQEAMWKAGEYDITMIDLTHRFPLPENVSSQMLCTYLHRNMDTAFRTAWFKSGIGSRMEAPRSNAIWTFYDKHQELGDKRKQAEKHLRAVAGDAADEIWPLLSDMASKSIRAELKLRGAYLVNNGLNRGSAWNLQCVQDVYFKELDRLCFQSHRSIDVLRDAISGVSNRTLRHTLELWRAGSPLNELFAESTLATHRAKIKAETGIDILLNRPTIEPLPLSEIFARDNCLGAFPAWVRDYPTAGFASPNSAMDQPQNNEARRHRGDVADGLAADAATTAFRSPAASHGGRSARRAESLRVRASRWDD